MNNVRLHYKFKTEIEMPISKAALMLLLLPRRNIKANPILRFLNEETFFSVFPYFMLLTELFILSSKSTHTWRRCKGRVWGRASGTEGSKCQTPDPWGSDSENIKIGRCFHHYSGLFTHVSSGADRSQARDSDGMHRWGTWHVMLRFLFQTWWN